MYKGRIATVRGSATNSIRFYIACYMYNGNHCAKKFGTRVEAKRYLKSLGQLHAQDA